MGPPRRQSWSHCRTERGMQEEDGGGATAWQDEALARDGVSREVPCSALKGETVPDSLLIIAFSAAGSMPTHLRISP